MRSSPIYQHNHLADPPLLQEAIELAEAASAAAQLNQMLATSSDRGKEMTNLVLLGALEDSLVVIIVDGVGDADGRADDADAVQDLAGGRRGEGEDCRAPC